MQQIFSYRNRIIKRDVIFYITICILFLGSTSIVSCKKMDTNTTPTTVTTTDFRSIKAGNQFNWSTTKTVTIRVSGLMTESSEKNTLTVKTMNDEIVFQNLMTMKESLSQKIILPVSISMVKVSYGKITKTINIVNNVADFNFVTPIPAQYE